MESVVYMLKGRSGRHYIGCTDNLGKRLEQHQRGHTHSSLRLGLPLELLAHRAFPTRTEAMQMEKLLKQWKNPKRPLEYLNR